MQPETSRIRFGAVRRQLPRVRLALLALFGLGGAAYFLTFVHELYPIQHWLFWRYLQAAVLSAALVAACISSGFLTLKLLLRRSLPLAEHFALAFAIGAYEFFLLMYAGGLLGLFGGFWFVLLPLVMFGAGAWPLFRYARRLRRHLLHARKSARPPAWWSYPVLAFGLLGLGMIYFLILTPDNVSYDSRWYHLGLAEEFAAAHGIERSAEGWYAATGPHLASVVYSWAMQMPRTTLFDRVELAAHIEFAWFVMTLVGVSALARRLVRGARPRHAWVVRFLFPGVLLYDSSLAVGADHLAAVFAAPIFLMLLRFWADPRSQWMLLLVVGVAAAAMTKYTGALLLIGFPILAVQFRLLVEVVRRLRKKPGAHPLSLFGMLCAGAGLGLLLTTPFWLKNWIWYGDPMYPLFHRYLPLDPWTEDSPTFLRAYMNLFWKPESNLDGLLESLKVLFTWAFVPNDWPQFHGKWPTFGVLFSLGLLLLPFLKKTKRIWALYAAVHFGIFTWYWLHHQDRYLQTAMPLIAAGTAAVLTLAWRQHWVVKPGIAAMVGAQIIWGGDVYFIQTHAIIGSPQKNVLDLLAQGFKKNYFERLRPFGTLYKLSKRLPQDAKVLFRDGRMRAGLRRRVVLDSPLTAGGLGHGRMKSPAELHARFERLGATHLLWHNQKSGGEDTLAGDLVFHHFASFVAQPHERFDGYVLAPVPVEPPSLTFDDRVLILGCMSSEYRPGLYRLAQLTIPAAKLDPPLEKPAPIVEITQQSYPEWVGKVDFLVFDRSCHDGSALKGHPEYVLGAKRRTLELWLKRPQR